PHPLELLPQPSAVAPRQEALVQAQRRRRPPGPDAQLVDVLRVYLGLLGRSGRECRTAPSRPSSARAAAVRTRSLGPIPVIHFSVETRVIGVEKSRPLTYPSSRRGP